jgi:hypothetical protein
MTLACAAARRQAPFSMGCGTCELGWSKRAASEKQILRYARPSARFAQDDRLRLFAKEEKGMEIGSAFLPLSLSFLFTKRTGMSS